MTARAPVLFPVPFGTSAAPCRGCGQLIYWITLPSMKRMPVDCAAKHGGTPPTLTADGAGVSHFATCSKASDFRRPR